MSLNSSSPGLMRVESENWQDTLSAQILNLDPKGEYCVSTVLTERRQDNLAGRIITL